MEFNTEEDRTKFIDGDREKRISLDAEDFKVFFKELSEETNEANSNLDQVTACYYDLENTILSYNVGTTCFLKEAERSEDYTGDHTLFYEEIPDPNVIGNHKYIMTFWRIGYCKIGNSWHLAALRYKIDSAEGPTPVHTVMGSPIRLTHAPRELRLEASHHIRDLLMLILNSVKYNKNTSRTALDRIDPLVTSLREHFEATGRL